MAPFCGWSGTASWLDRANTRQFTFYQKFLELIRSVFSTIEPIFSIVFTNILKIYELPQIYNKILKKLLTIIIYHSMPQVHLASEIYWKCTLESKRLFWHEIEKILEGYFLKKCMARVLLYCCIRCCPYSLQLTLYIGD